MSDLTEVITLLTQIEKNTAAIVQLLLVLVVIFGLSASFRIGK